MIVYFYFLTEHWKILKLNAQSFDFDSECARMTTNKGLITVSLNKSENFSKITFLWTTSDSLSVVSSALKNKTYLKIMSDLHLLLIQYSKLALPTTCI